jgi:hypothetical protein
MTHQRPEEFFPATAAVLDDGVKQPVGAFHGVTSREEASNFSGLPFASRMGPSTTSHQRLGLRRGEETDEVTEPPLRKARFDSL